MRLLGAVPLLLGAVTLIFFAVEAMPGDAVDLWLHPGMTESVRAQVRENLGLDRSAPVRYGVWLKNLVSGDLGYSVSRSRPVAEVLRELLPNTLLLSSVALVLGFLLGIAVGIWQSVRVGSWVDTTLSAISLFFYSMPTFWLAVMAFLVFAYWAGVWGWPIVLPASGVVDVNHDSLGVGARILDRVRHLVLPAASLSLVLAGGVARYTRASMLEALGREHVRAARARGLPERSVVLRQGLRNALPPLITLFGLSLPLLLSGAIFVEEVFAWPGMGQLMFSAISSRDTHVIMACAVLFSVMVVIGNLFADILHEFVDPRVSSE